MSYYEKYLKYKEKYLSLKAQRGGAFTIGNLKLEQVIYNDKQKLSSNEKSVLTSMLVDVLKNRNYTELLPPTELKYIEDIDVYNTYTKVNEDTLVSCDKCDRNWTSDYGDKLGEIFPGFYLKNFDVFFCKKCLNKASGGPNISGS